LRYTPAAFKIVRLHDCPVDTPLLNTADAVVKFWQQHVATTPWFDPEKECACLFLLNCRRHITGWHLLGIGTANTVLMRAAELFRPAIIANASALVVAHNHPSGNPNPSETDIEVTRALIEASKLLNIDLLDHVIIGRGGGKAGSGYMSLRELGYFDSLSNPEAGAVPAGNENARAASAAAKNQSEEILETNGDWVMENCWIKIGLTRPQTKLLTALGKRWQIEHSPCATAPRLLTIAGLANVELMEAKILAMQRYCRAEGFSTLGRYLDTILPKVD
jgi:hypothetical protein